jgi:predicted alpha/beta-hydrolase family hydrolase
VATLERYTVSLAAGGHVTAIRYAPAEPRVGELVLAHGAGANQLHAFMVGTAEGLARRGVETTTFNFSYTEEGRRAPDPAPKLQACFRDVVSAVRARGARERPLFLGGKSMGGRMASHLGAEGEPNVAGLVFLGYPLHPPGKPEQERSKHLPRITAPMLFVQGTRDPFGTPDELAPVLARLPAKVVVFPIDQGGHSFEVPKRAGRTQEEILDAIWDRIAAFVQFPSPPAPLPEGGEARVRGGAISLEPP